MRQLQRKARIGTGEYGGIVSRALGEWPREFDTRIGKGPKSADRWVAAVPVDVSRTRHLLIGIDVYTLHTISIDGESQETADVLKTKCRTAALGNCHRTALGKTACYGSLLGGHGDGDDALAHQPFCCGSGINGILHDSISRKVGKGEAGTLGRYYICCRGSVCHVAHKGCNVVASRPVNLRSVE